MADHSAPDRRIDTKVWAATVAAGAAAGGVTILNAVQDQPDLLGALPTWSQSLILLVVPPLITFLSGYFRTSNRV